MTTAPLYTYDTAADLGESLATRIADAISAKLSAGGQFVLGCPGGRTPMTTYQALARELGRRQLDLRGVVIAMMDDYVVEVGDNFRHVDADAHYSCRRFAKDEIQAVLNGATSAEHAIADANVWFPDPAQPDEYEDRLREAGGIDFFILASGAGDGHVAFNPPGSGVFEGTRIVRLAEQTRQDNLATFPEFGGIDDVPTHGVTVGIATIAGLSKDAAMILVGSDKQRAFRELTAGDDYNPAWPATVFHLIEGAALYADRDAAGR